MKKKLLLMAMAALMTAAFVPAAFAAENVSDKSELTTALSNGETAITINGTVDLGTDTLIIDHDVTITGGIINYDGNDATKVAIEVTNGSDLTMNGVTLNATQKNGRAIKIDAAATKLVLEDSTFNVGNRGIWLTDEGLDGTGGITLDNTTIQSTKKPADKTYENWSDQGDSRGISLWNLNHATVDIINGSQILGFGYPINLAGVENGGVRDTNDSTINITDSNIYGWCALNIWTIDTIYNITNSNLKGFVETDNEWNSFATVVLNEGIYGNLTDEDDKANVFNFKGGSVSSDCVTTNDEVFHILFRLDKEFMSKFNFQRNGRNQVALTCASPYSAFVATYTDMSMSDFENWAQNKL
ncbi:MAG: hypothetical protein Q4C56_09300, partial [Peptococcaceae bacterium]|nr:hypothetical protein [Peptococcaceae bacterium]